MSTLPSNLAKLIADIEFEDELNSCPIKSVRTNDQSMTRLVDLIDELGMNFVGFGFLNSILITNSISVTN